MTLTFCTYCGTEIEDDREFCDDLCKQSAEGIEICWDCEVPLADCSCPPIREVKTVLVKAGLL